MRHDSPRRKVNKYIYTSHQSIHVVRAFSIWCIFSLMVIEWSRKTTTHCLHVKSFPTIICAGEKYVLVAITAILKWTWIYLMDTKVNDFKISTLSNELKWHTSYHYILNSDFNSKFKENKGLLSYLTNNNSSCFHIILKSIFLQTKTGFWKTPFQINNSCIFWDMS